MTAGLHNEAELLARARTAYVLGLLNMAVRAGLGDNVADVQVLPAQGVMDVTFRRLNGRRYRLTVVEFPVENQEEGGR